MHRRGLLGSLFALPLISKAAPLNIDISKVQLETILSPLRYAKGIAGFGVPGITHILKAVNLKTGIVSNELGLGVIYLDARGIFTEDENYANL